MSKRAKTRQEIANSFHANVSEISRLLGCSYETAKRLFSVAQAADKEELGSNYFDRTKVRISSVLRVAGITEEEMRTKIEQV